MEQLAVVLGGDRRQLYAAEHLAKRDYDVFALAFGEAAVSDKVKKTEELSVLNRAKLALFPLGVSKDGKLNAAFSGKDYALGELLAMLPEDCLLFGGNVTQEEQRLAGSYGLVFRDYFKEEELTVANALLTAEGAIALAMENLPDALWRKNALICGYGRIGRALLSRLKPFGMELSVLARSPQQRIWAEVEGAKAYDFSHVRELLPRQQLIFNTVPYPWLGQELSLVEKDCLVLELASKPYGVDKALARQLGKQVLSGAALPGKYAPKTAGEQIAECILTMR